MDLTDLKVLSSLNDSVILCTKEFVAYRCSVLHQEDFLHRLIVIGRKGFKVKKERFR